MNPETLQRVFSDAEIVRDAGRDARAIALQAREETRVSVERLNEQVQLDVARAVGAVVELVSVGEEC